MLYFPTVHSITLEGEPLTLPYGADGEFMALLLGFNPTQQIETRSWLPILTEVRQFYDQFNYYEIPILHELNPAQQNIVQRSMQRSITRQERRQHVVPLYVNKGALRRSLRIVNEYHTNILLIDREGGIHWRAEGFASLLKQAQFRRALAHIAPQTASK